VGCLPSGRTGWQIATLTLVMLAASSAVAADGTASQGPRRLNLDSQPWKGDLEGMLERRVIRVLVPYSRSLYFVDKGQQRGIEAELVRDLEQYLNRKHAKRLGRRPLTVFLIPTPRDKLLSGVAEGRGDIAAGNLTVTAERIKLVDFVVPKDRKPVQELIVTGPASPRIATLDDLSGKTIHVRRATSYYESVLALNQRLQAQRKPPVKIVALPDVLEDEDKLEMLNAGLLQLVVMDDWKARMWAQILPRITVREDLVMRARGRIGWAVRQGSPGLRAAIDDFYRSEASKFGGIDARVAKFHKNVRHITNSTSAEEKKRFDAMFGLFQKYGTRYRFDPHMLAAQAYQESQLRQDARSRVGAIGVMQLMPATGKALGVGDITLLEPNIHAGAKYLDQLMTSYFIDAKFSEMDRPLFAFASYNAGPGRISRMRKEAGEQGLDADKWFDNVELVVAQRIGLQTTTYVRNIFKYYTAYRLLAEAQLESRRALGTVRPDAR
jgi:membrane-bound lytic murein transglycosylase MltF